MIATSARERTPATHRLALGARPFEFVGTAILRYGLVFFLSAGA